MQTLTTNDLLRFRLAGSLALRPGGEELAFVEMWCDDEADANRTAIYLVPTDGSAPARRVTFGENGDSSPKWSPDGRYLGFVSAREVAWRRDLYVLDMQAGGDARKLASLPRGIGEFAWSADGTKVALTGRPAYPDDAHRPTEDEAERRARYGKRVVHVERLHYRGDGAGITDDEGPQLWIADVDGDPGADGPRVLVDHTYPLSSPGFAPDGRVTFVSRREPDHEITWNDQVWAVAVDGGEPERLSDVEGSVSAYCFTAGGSLVLDQYPMAGLPLGCVHDHLVIDGKTVELADNFGKHALADTVDPVSSGTQLLCDGDDVWFVITREGAVHLWKHADGVASPVIEHDGVIGEIAVGDGIVAFTNTTTTEHATIRVAKTDGSGERVVHVPNPWMDDITVGKVEDLWVEVDGVRSHAFVILPPGGIGDTPPPAILTQHGGPHSVYGRGFNLLLQMLAIPGYSVIVANPPGSLSYGEDYALMTHKRFGEAELPHLMAMVDEAVARGWADPDRLGTTGGSYGGFLTLWDITQTDRFKAAVSGRGVVDWSSIFASSEFGWGLVHGCFGCYPWEDPELYRRLSPLTYAENITTPLRLIGCTDDHRVPMEQVEQMYIRLKILAKAPVDLVVFRDSHHLIYSGPPWNKVDHMQSILDWFERYL